MAEYIEREKVLGTIDELQRICATEVPEDKAEIYNDVFEEVYGEITRISAADVRPERHGNWVKESKMMGAFQRNLCICNICGCWYDEDGCEEAFKYCPKCGAKMDGKEENHHERVEG